MGSAEPALEPGNSAPCFFCLATATSDSPALLTKEGVSTSSQCCRRRPLLRNVPKALGKKLSWGPRVWLVISLQVL